MWKTTKKILKWIAGPVIVIFVLIALFVLILPIFQTRTESFDAEYEQKAQDIEKETKKEHIKKTLQFLKNWFAVFLLVFLAGCGWKTLIIPEPPLVPKIEFPDKVNYNKKIELEPYDAKMLKIYLKKHNEYRQKLFELFEKL